MTNIGHIFELQKKISYLHFIHHNAAIRRGFCSIILSMFQGEKGKKKKKKD